MSLFGWLSYFRMELQPNIGLQPILERPRLVFIGIHESVHLTNLLSSMLSRKKKQRDAARVVTNVFFSTKSNHFLNL